MTKVSPLGAIAIAILVARWNDSQNEERKKSIKKFLQLGNFQLRRQAINNLLELANDQLCGCKFIWSGTVPIKAEYLLTAIATATMDNLGKGKRENFTNELFDKAIEEAIDYFIDVFKAGHFKKLPVLELYHGISFIDQARFHVSKHYMANEQLGEDENPGQGQEDPN